ncbi:MAG: pentapeptide repeat-containing protein [Methanosarcinales archaeon]|nr:pentapeptide repeat-containing protein [Methanosarcinales archaeon]
MKPKNVIMWALLPVIVVLLMSTSAQAKELTEVPASDILEKIQAGEDVLFDHVYVTGALDLSNIELEPVFIVRTGHQLFYGLKEELKPIESPITITNSVFENDVNFQNAWFRNPINFRGTTFSCKTNFRGAIFDYYVLFNDARFDDDACFDRVTFGGSANFENANFCADIGFKDALFKHDADFFNTTVGGDAGFEFASFSDDAYFGNANFCDYVNFEVVSFTGRAHFGYTNFGSVADFTSVNFRDDASFMYTTFSDDAEFWHTHFSGNAYFNSVKFRGNAEFTSAEFDEVDFSNTAFSQFFLLHDADFKRIKVSWSSLKDLYSFDGPTYIKLIKNFREMEQFEDADGAYYQYRRVSQANKNWSLSKLGDVVAWLTCGYGVKPGYAAACAVVTTIIFTPIYWWRGGIRRTKENDEVDEQDVSRWKALGDAFYFSVVTFTTIGSGDLYPADRYRKAAVVIEGLLGWLILALFIVTLANVMIRP